jgi:hypothetical protein
MERGNPDVNLIERNVVFVLHRTGIASECFAMTVTFRIASLHCVKFTLENDPELAMALV